jgi:hypothetical protein
VHGSHGISRDVRKLARTPKVIKKKHTLILVATKRDQVTKNHTKMPKTATGKVKMKQLLVMLGALDTKDDCSKHHLHLPLRTSLQLLLFVVVLVIFQIHVKLINAIINVLQNNHEKLCIIVSND